jgi:hypothetical protein
MEWSIAPDTFKLQVGQHQFSSTNGGGLVNRAARSGQWQRISDIFVDDLKGLELYSNLLL